MISRRSQQQTYFSNIKYISFNKIILFELKYFICQIKAFRHVYEGIHNNKLYGYNTTTKVQSNKYMYKVQIFIKKSNQLYSQFYVNCDDYRVD